MRGYSLTFKFSVTLTSTLFNIVYADRLEKEMATHSSIFAWRIPWTEETGGLQSRGVTRAGHDLVTKPPPY